MDLPLYRPNIEKMNSITDKMVIDSTGALNIAGFTPSASTTGSFINTGTTWINNTAVGGGCVKLLCSSSATSGDFHTLRIRARADAAGNVVAGNFSASAGAAQYGNLIAVQGYAQPNAKAQSGAGNIICGLYACDDLLATGSSGRSWDLWVDTHMAAKAAASSFLARFSHNGTVAADGLFTIYGGGRLPLFMQIEDATPGFVVATGGTYSTADGYLVFKIGASTYRLPYFAGTD
jgi:hypothetical protein